MTHKDSWRYNPERAWHLIIGLVKGDTRSLDYSSYEPGCMFSFEGVDGC